jgi:hypothetical protein
MGYVWDVEGYVKGIEYFLEIQLARGCLVVRAGYKRESVCSV